MDTIERLKLLIRSGLATERAFKEAGEAAVIRAKTEGAALLRAYADDVVINREARTARFVWSTAAVDRMGDIIDVAGWDTRDFSQNPIVLYQHDHDTPLGNSPQHAKDVAGGKLWGDIKFAPEGTDPFIDSRWKLVEAGILRATSVGFLPEDVHVPSASERKELGMGAYGVIYRRQALLENSIVTVPANPEALAASVKGVLSEAEADAFMREHQATEREIFRRLNGLASRRSSAPVPTLPPATGEQIEKLSATVTRLEAVANVLLGRLSATAVADARQTQDKGWDAGELLQLIDRHTPQGGTK